MLFKMLSFGFNNCLQCGSFAFRPSMLCEVCEHNLFVVAAKPNQFKSEVKNVPCLALFHWKRDQNRILNRLSLAMKGNRQVSAWRYYGERFLDHWLQLEDPAKDAVLVPCPSSGDCKDHSYLFAESLSNLTGIPLLLALEKADISPQKRLSRRERVQRSGSRLELRNNVDEKFSQVYFVDDIITTGATVLAASMHLQRLGRVKALSLIIRR